MTEVRKWTAPHLAVPLQVVCVPPNVRALEEGTAQVETEIRRRVPVVIPARPWRARVLVVQPRVGSGRGTCRSGSPCAARGSPRSHRRHTARGRLDCRSQHVDLEWRSSARRLVGAGGSGGLFGLCQACKCCLVLRLQSTPTSAHHPQQKHDNSASSGMNAVHIGGLATVTKGPPRPVTRRRR